MIRFFLIFIFFYSFYLTTNALVLPDGSPTLYQIDQDNIEILDVSNLKNTIFGSERAWIVEFYSHWCGACQRYAPHWKELALNTKPWHSKVIQVGAINCADSKNDDICQSFNIEYYPTLRIFPPYADFNKPEHDSMIINNRDDVQLKMVEFVEKIDPIPKQWPILKEFTSKRLDVIFLPNRQIKYGFLIVEDKDSVLGKQLILDFSSFSENVIVRRMTEETNPILTQKLGVDTHKLPLIFLVENTKVAKNYQRFSDSKKFEPANIDSSLEPRARFKLMIEKFLIDKVIGAKIENNNEQKNDNLLNVVDDKQTHDVNKIYMLDLESSLNVLLRSEISHSQVLDGEKINVLKQWVKILTKYFPGRQEVKRYLANLNTKLSTLELNEISGTKWKQMTLEDQTPESNLPDKTEWVYCKGSKPNYRGFPCSLWTLFHTLTISQIEYENSKTKPFDAEFDVKEVFESVRSFVKHFFRCEECSKNFMNETQDYLSHLKEPHDTVLYLWTVHNRVNKRLADDMTTDPVYPKIQFPSKEQCSACYNGSEFVNEEVFKFLSSYYSSSKIEAHLAQITASNDQIEDPDFGGDEPKDLDKIDGDIEEQPKEILSSTNEDKNSSRPYLFIFFILFVCVGAFFIYTNIKKGKYKLQKHIV